jgi:hypothetical protein
MAGINFQRTYQLHAAYESSKNRAAQKLDNYREYLDLITFNDLDRSITFSTERLILAASVKRPRVMLLFSNPHPYSVHQGMFLSPNTKGRENSFWPIMEDAGWHYHKNYRQFRKGSLDTIRAAICSRPGTSKHDG